MAMTLEQLRSQLSTIEPEESTYAGIGAAEIPLLEQLLQDEEAWMASRAVFALSRQPDPQAISILSRVAADPRPELRVALAASTANLPPRAANNILLTLLDDADVGVRKFAVEAVSGKHNPAVHAKVRDIGTQDPEPVLRDVAKSKLSELRRIGPSPSR